MTGKYVEIGKRILEARNAKGLKQKDCLLPLGGITIQMLSSWEHGHVFPSLTYLVKISEFFGISLDYLILGKRSSIDIDGTITYSRIFYCLLTLLNSGIFSFSSYIGKGAVKELNITTTNKEVLEFDDMLGKIIDSKNLYEEDDYKRALRKLLDSNKEIVETFKQEEKR